MAWFDESTHHAATSGVTFSMKDLKQTIQIAREQMEFAEFDIPKDRFVEYEPKDREWLEYFGFIKKRPRFSELHIHPETMKVIGDKLTAHATCGIPLYSNQNIPVGVCIGFDSRPYRMNSFGGLNVASFK